MMDRITLTYDMIECKKIKFTAWDKFLALFTDSIYKWLFDIEFNSVI